MRKQSTVKKFLRHLKRTRYTKRQLNLLAIVAVFGVLGIALLVSTRAAGFTLFSEAESGTVTGNATKVSLAGASGQAVRFNAGATPPTTPPPTTGGSRQDYICGGSFNSTVGGSTQTVPAPASGRTLTVGSGKQHSSLSSALSAAQAGDNILVDPGNYSETGTFNKSGSAGRCVTIAGNGGKAIFRGGGRFTGSYIRLVNIGVAGSGGFALNSNSVNNISIQNFSVAGSSDGGLYFTNSRYLLIDGCDISGTNSRGTSAAGEALSIADGSTDAEIRYCKVHDNGEEGIDVKYSNNKNTNTKVHNNEAYRNRGPNIYIDGVNGVEVYNNKIYSTTNSSKPGLMVGCEAQYAPDPVNQNIKIYNNLIYDNAASGIGAYTEEGGRMANISIYNNTVVGNRGAAMDNINPSGTNPMYNNIFVGSVNKSGFTDGGNFTSDPGFVGNGDYRLRAGSAAINTAKAAGAPAFDFLGIARPQGSGVDYGAYEQ